MEMATDRERRGEKKKAGERSEDARDRRDQTRALETPDQEKCQKNGKRSKAKDRNERTAQRKTESRKGGKWQRRSKMREREATEREKERADQNQIMDEQIDCAFTGRGRKERKSPMFRATPS
jgi:hypothetical protein